MNEDTISILLVLNQRFYEQFAGAFAQTRRRIQDGVRRALGMLPDEGDWVDLGCGSGALAQAWIQAGRASHYLGLDFSVDLLAEARKLVGANEWVELRVANMGDEHWADGLEKGAFRGALAFAALHHVPSAALRLRVLRQIRGLLSEGGWFVHSEWQFQHSPKLMARRLPWERAGLSEVDVETGDTLLDWRFALPGQAEQVGLRYVHLFSREELAGLAAQSGFEISETYESDGEGGRLGLYQVWKAAG